MSDKFIKKDQNTVFEIAGSGNTWTVKKGVTIDSTTSGIYESASLHDNKIVIDGTVIGTGYSEGAIYSLGDDAVVEVSSSGKLSGNFGIMTSGDNARIVNYGHITSSNVAIGMDGENSHFINHGTIKAGHYAYDGHYTKEFTFDNDGKITTETGLSFDAKLLTATFGEDSIVRSKGYVINTQTSVTETAHITNKGDLTALGNGFLTAVYGGDGVETLRNSGVITGNVELKGGDDRYDGRGGQVLDGVVVGGDGNDTYLLSDKHTRVFDGLGGGLDKLVVSFSYKLEAGNEIENLKLSGKGDFDLHGNDEYGSIIGNRGDNKLFGMGNEDALFGGKGNDTLTGGEGNDIFYFKQHADKEIVADFTDGQDYLVFFEGKDITSINDLLKHHTEQHGDDLVIAGDGTEMIIRNFEKANFDASDFVT